MFSSGELEIPPKGKAICPTDIAVAIPEGHYGRVGNELFTNLSPAIGIDSEEFHRRGRRCHRCRLLRSCRDRALQLWRGPHHSDAQEVFNIRPGDRVAQLILEKISTPTVVTTDLLPDSTRGTGGFGSTGKRKLEDS